MVPLADTVRTVTVKVSDPSVNKSAVGVMVNAPTLLLTLKLPLIALKSAFAVLLLTMDQYRVVPLGTLVVLMPNVPVLPSSMLLG